MKICVVPTVTEENNLSPCISFFLYLNLSLRSKAAGNRRPVEGGEPRRSDPAVHDGAVPHGHGLGRTDQGEQPLRCQGSAQLHRKR